MNKLHSSIAAMAIVASGCGQVSEEVTQLQLAPVPNFSGLYDFSGGPPEPLFPCTLTANGEWRKDCSNFPFTDESRQRMQAWDVLDDRGMQCLPDGVPRVLLRLYPIEITQTEQSITMRFEAWDVVRTIHMDGSTPPGDLEHSPLGYSVGRWEGETLIVETTHVTEAVLSLEGVPYSERSRVIERYWRGHNGNNLLLDVVLDDAVNYSRPFLLTRRELSWNPDGVIYPWQCEPHFDLYSGEDPFFAN